MKLTVVSNAPSSPLFTAQYSNFDTSDFNLTSHVPSFYRDIRTVWQELHSMNPSTTMEYQHETIWNDCFIKIHGKPVFYSSWYRRGVTKIHHLLNERGNVLSRPDYQRKKNYLICP